MRNVAVAVAALWAVIAAAGPVRVVSLSPAVTEMALSLGCREQLAGRSSACDQAEARGIPVVGDLGRPFVEPLLQSGARIVVTDMQVPGPQWAALKKFGVSVVVLPAEKLSDLPDNLRRMGRILGCEARAETLARTMTEELAELRRVPPPRRVRTLVVLGLPPVVSCGKGSFVTDALALAGVDNIAASASDGYFILSTELIHRADPELILSFVPEAATVRYFSRREYRGMSAVKARRFRYPPIEELCRLTPKLPAALRRLRSDVECEFPQQLPEKAVELLH